MHFIFLSAKIIKIFEIITNNFIAHYQCAINQYDKNIIKTVLSLILILFMKILIVDLLEFEMLQDKSIGVLEYIFVL